MALDPAAENRPGGLDDAAAYDVSRPVLADAGDGATVFAATRRRDGAPMAAHLVLPGRGARLDMIRKLRASPAEGTLMPLALIPLPPEHGVPPFSMALLTPPPPGPSLAAARKLADADAIEGVLLPACAALRELHARGVTHRGVRLGNVFLAGRTLSLGQAWSAPPASLQPPAYETPENAMCLPCGRADGLPADDIYALGAVILYLVTGRRPAEAADGVDIVADKLELGSAVALLGADRLQPRIADLLRVMLADDPGHRPTAAMLCDTKASPGRKLAQRSARRAVVPLDVGGTQAWNARGAAYALVTQPDGPEALRDGRVDKWLRRGLGDAATASSIEDLVRARPSRGRDPMSDAWQMMSAVALLDPLAPMCWRGAMVWPDGLPDALAAAQGEDPARPADAVTLDLLEEAVAQEVIAAHAAVIIGDRDAVLLRDRLAGSRRIRGFGQHKGLAGGRPRLLYGLNPALPCLSPRLGGRAVLELPALLHALERQSHAPGVPEGELAEPQLMAFIASRSEPLARLLGGGDAIGLLRCFAELQRVARGRFPGLARRCAARVQDELRAWQHAPTRAERIAAMTAAVEAGDLAAVLKLADEPQALLADQQGAARARDAIAQMNLVLSHLRDAPQARNLRARATGREIAAGTGLSLFATLLLVAILG